MGYCIEKNLHLFKSCLILHLNWRGAGVVERGSLENCCTVYPYREFESRSLRRKYPKRTVYKRFAAFFSMIQYTII